MKNTILTYLAVLFLITLTSCQHREHQSKISSPEDLILGFKFNETTLKDIKKRFNTYGDKDECFLIDIKQLKFLDAKKYIVSYENEKLFGIFIEFDLARYDEFVNFFSKYSKPLNTQGIGNLTSEKGFYIKNLEYTVSKIKNRIIISVFPNNNTDAKQNISVTAPQKDVIKFFKQNL